MRVLGGPKVGAEAHRGARGEARVCKPQAERHRRAQQHETAIDKDHAEVGRHDPPVHDLRHEHGDGKLQARLESHAEHGEQKLAPMAGAHEAGHETDPVQPCPLSSRLPHTVIPHETAESTQQAGADATCGRAGLDDPGLVSGRERTELDDPGLVSG